MRYKFVRKLAIAGLAVVFLLSMSSYAPAQKGKRGKKVKKLYKVSISINDVGMEGLVPGIENRDLIGFKGNGDPIFGEGVCGQDHFYAEGSELRYLIFSCRSEGRKTPGPDDEVAPLNMWVNLPYDQSPITLEQCEFHFGYDEEGKICHGEKDPDRSPWWLHIAIYERQSNTGDLNTEAIEVYWTFDYELVTDSKGKKPRERGWRLVSWQGPGNYVEMTQDFPEEPFKEIGDTWWTDVIGTFVLMHDGYACGGKEEENYAKELPNFNIRIDIERVR